jgi:hypothetical protein
MNSRFAKSQKRSEPFREFGDSDTGDSKGKGVKEPNPVKPFSAFLGPGCSRGQESGDVESRLAISQNPESIRRNSTPFRHFDISGFGK